MPLPPYIPPSPQASIAATRTLAQVFLMRFRVMVVEYHHILQNHGLSTNYLGQSFQQKGKKGKKPPPPVAIPDSLPTAALEFYTKLEQIALYVINRFDALLNLCRTSNSNKSLVEVLQQTIEALFVIISSTRKVIYVKRIPEVTKQATEQMADRVGSMTRLLEELSALAPDEDAHSRSLLQRIEKVLRSEFYEEVSREEKMAMSKDVGDGVGSFGGHWYTCPNGHVYTIGECGGAMQASRCPECGAAVGGANHHVTTGTHVYAVATDFLASINQLQPGHGRNNV